MTPNRVVVSISLEPAILDELEAWRARRNLTRSAALRDCITKTIRPKPRNTKR